MILCEPRSMPAHLHTPYADLYSRSSRREQQAVSKLNFLRFLRSAASFSFAVWQLRTGCRFFRFFFLKRILIVFRFSLAHSPQVRLISVSVSVSFALYRDRAKPEKKIVCVFVCGELLVSRYSLERERTHPPPGTPGIHSRQAIANRYDTQQKKSQPEKKSAVDDWR